ncbi:dihydroneopterin aldolase family protein [Methanobacterium congolense]|uniref:dihydroneopterin aldolase family protein n=1 Tax=Methanobacterium congolense TaxID=118062 RepID=UPI0009039F7C|nr:dihydroneopterin aldolase family protein [Methanobacterium congolense]
MDVDSKYFSNISERERAIFEGAITMGALFHQFVGTPVSIRSASSLERSIKDAMELQPCINRLEVTINRDTLHAVENEYDYISLTGEMLDVRVWAVYGNKEVVVRLKYVEELNYPLMYVENIGEV